MELAQGAQKNRSSCQNSTLPPRGQVCHDKVPFLQAVCEIDRQIGLEFEPSCSDALLEETRPTQHSHHSARDQGSVYNPLINQTLEPLTALTQEH